MNDPHYRISDDGTEILQGNGEQESGILSISECREPEQLQTMCDYANITHRAITLAGVDDNGNINEADPIAQFVFYAKDVIEKLRDALAKAKTRAGGQFHQECVDQLNEAEKQSKRLLAALGTE